MPFDDDPDDERPVPDRLLPPEDRLWRHPSELGAGVAHPFVGSAPAGRTDRRSPATGALIGACLAGAVVAFGAMWLARPTRVVEHDLPANAVRSAATTQQASFSTDPVPTERLAAQMAPSLATLRVEHDGGWSTSSALWIDDRGTLAAAMPVVVGATQLVVVGDDGVSRKARLAGVDAATGIASLVVDRTAGTPITLATSKLKAGEPAALVGAPGGDAGNDDGHATVSSVLVRSVSLRATVGDLVLHDAVQLDREVPADALGGALVDVDGGLLGMVLGNSGEHQLGTVASGAAVIDTASALRDDGEVRRAWLGVEAVDLDPGQASLLEVEGGAHLTEVTPGSPAAKAGLRPGDVVTAVGGRPVDDASDLVVGLRSREPGDRTVVEVRRAGKTRQLTATLGG
ncbi:S1C family serine protease [Aquihabitans sp. G128]|uniref:S1C family serine protease n=1 Tax=Aquihabitans sp. G128 TaxID=2849779 RepID=UPI001C241D82|nr:S1C family serine protease [Aquihabitans sp. G128]QXC60455.1 S1C family serine protease [Aquihabitans sp. G128]